MYDKIKLEESDQDFINKLRNDEIHGINVTVPFKNKVIRYLDKLSLEVETTDLLILFIKAEMNNLQHDVAGFELDQDTPNECFT